MENTQDRAERRRQLYVSLTRVRDLLIIVGAPKKVTMNGSRDIVIPSEAFGIKNHGAMLLQSIWTHLHKSGKSQISSLTHRHYTNMMRLWMPN